MSKFKLHKLAAVAVTIGFAAWMLTGEFSSVGSAQTEAGTTPAEPKEADAGNDDVVGIHERLCERGKGSRQGQPHCPVRA